MKKMNLLMLVMLALALVSCKAKEETEAEPAATAPATIEGIWSTDCIVDNTDSYIETIQVQSGTMTWAKIHYNGSTVCDPANRMATIMKSGAITVADGEGSIAGGKNFEWQLSTAVAVPEDDAVVADLNVSNACGSNMWVKDQAGLIFACNVGSAFDLTQIMPNAVDYGVFVIESAAAPDSLQFGAKCSTPGYDGHCPTVGERPTSVDSTVYYRR